MAERVKRPPKLTGDEKEQIQQIWDYLFSTADTINFRLDGIGSNDLTDRERETLRPILGDTKNQLVTLKNMIVKMAEYIRKK